MAKKKAFIEITNEQLYADFKAEFKSLHEKVDAIVTSEKVCKATVNNRLDWHQKAIYAGGSVLLCIVGYLVALGIEVAKVKAVTP